MGGKKKKSASAAKAASAEAVPQASAYEKHPLQLKAEEHVAMLEAQLEAFNKENSDTNNSGPPASSDKPGVSSVNHNKVTYIQAHMNGEIARWKREAARGPDQRVKDTKSPPRDVLQVLRTVEPDPARRGPIPTINGAVVLTVTRHMDHQTFKQAIGFRVGTEYRLGSVPWKREMGAWGCEAWAWFFCGCFRRLAVDPTTVHLSYKLQDRPAANQQDFLAGVDEAFIDISNGERYRGEWGERGCNVSFQRAVHGRDADRLNDLALAFDEPPLHAWCLEMGLLMENRSGHPARAFEVGDGLRVVDCTGKVYNSHKDYVDARLSAAIVSEQLKAEGGEELAARKAFLWEVVSMPALRDAPLADAWTLYDKFKTKQPEEVASDVCIVCGAKEGALRPNSATEEVVGKMMNCACKDGKSLYCGKVCQKMHWKTHKAVCPLAQQILKNVKEQVAN